MAKLVILVALFGMAAVAFCATEAVNKRPVDQGKPLFEGKTGDLQAASSLYGGFVGGYGPFGYGYGFGYPFYGHGYYGGYGYGYPFHGGYAHGFAY